jgi:hypothetical protein
MTRAYKFMREGAVSPYAGVHWREGEWVEAGPPLPCRRGVHACRATDLPYWLNAELWEVELDGEVLEAGHKLVAERGRLVRRIDRWDRRAFRKLAASCAVEARGLRMDSIAGDCQAAIADGAYALAVYFAAAAAERAEGEGGRLRERRRQAEWLAENVLAPRRARVFGRRG